MQKGGPRVAFFFACYALLSLAQSLIGPGKVTMFDAS